MKPLIIDWQLVESQGQDKVAFLIYLTFEDESSLSLADQTFVMMSARIPLEMSVGSVLLILAQHYSYPLRIGATLFAGISICAIEIVMCQATSMRYFKTTHLIGVR